MRLEVLLLLLSLLSTFTFSKPSKYYLVEVEDEKPKPEKDDAMNRQFPNQYDDRGWPECGKCWTPAPTPFPFDWQAATLADYTPRDYWPI